MDVCALKDAASCYILQVVQYCLRLSVKCTFNVHVTITNMLNIKPNVNSYFRCFVNIINVFFNHVVSLLSDFL